jgi:hypothetical protein
MSVSFMCCLLSGRGHCDGLITRPEELYNCGMSEYEEVLTHLGQFVFYLLLPVGLKEVIINMFVAPKPDYKHKV